MVGKYLIMFGFGMLCGAGIIQTREANLIGIMIIFFGILYMVLQAVTYSTGVDNGPSEGEGDKGDSS